MSNHETSKPSGPGRADAAVIALLAVWVITTRVPYMDTFALMGKDGPLYVMAMSLGRDYRVPMPGNIGYVLLGKLAHVGIADPVHAFEAVAIALTATAAAFTYLIGIMVLPRTLAAASAFALTCSATVWWHGGPITSYLTWLAALPAIGYFGIRFVRFRRTADLIGASVALGIGTILRQDMIASGTPLWLGCLALGRASRRQWLIGGAIVAASCACWFLGTAAVLGGVDVYLERVRAKHGLDMEGYSVFHRGLFEGLLRNVSKYAIFLIWSAQLVLIPFAVGAASCLRSARSRWRAPMIGLLWVGPSWYYSSCVFAGNAGLIFPLLPLLFLVSARGLQVLCGGYNARRPALLMMALALLSVIQFTQSPLLRETDQRRLILNTVFFKYAGPALKQRYNSDLADRGVDLSLRSLLKQMRDPDPLPDATVHRAHRRPDQS